MTSIVKHRAAIALLVALLSNFSNCDYCPVSAPTVSVVSKCPTTKAEWDEAASRKKCSLMTAKCGNKSPVYHCLLNQWRNETVEVCASNWFISGFCAIYNTEEMKVIDDFNKDCTNFTSGPCPTRYISTDAYMYQGCYGKRNTSISMPSTDKQVHVSTDCTLPAAIIAIIIVLSLLSLLFVLLLVLTCQEKISKQVIVQCIRSCKNTTDEENGTSETRPISPHRLERRQDRSPVENMTIDTEPLLRGGLERRQDRSTDENMTIDTEPLLRDDQKGDGTPTNKREEENKMKPVKEIVKEIDQKGDGTPTNKREEENKMKPVKEIVKEIETDNVKETDKNDEGKRRKSGQNLKTTSNASISTTDTSKKDENLRQVKKEEREPTSFERTNFPRDDRKSECNVKDPSNNMEDLNTKNGDLNVDSEEEGKVIIDGRTDSPDNDRKLESIDRVEQEDDRLHENVSKVMEMQCMPSNEISAGKNERGSESKSESQKEPEIGEENNEEEVFDSNTDIESSSSTGNESKNSTEKEEKLDVNETQNLVKSRVENFQKWMTSKQNQ